MIEKLRALWADAQAWLAAATPREKRLLAMAAGGVALFIALVAWASFSASIRKAQAALEEKQLDFEKFASVLRMMQAGEHLTESGLRVIARITEQMNRRQRSRYLESSEAIRQPTRMTAS